VSALDYTNEVQISGYSIPAIDTRRAETDIELRDGQTFALTGLLDHRLTDEFEHMPVISSIPILGMLFRSKSVQQTTTDLMVMVTPHIVNTLNGPEATQPTPPGPVKPYLDKKSFDKAVNGRK
jgi:pilus assembly protein CpaC